MVLNLPVNSLSFGNVSFNILRELFLMGEEVSLFPIGEMDVSAFTLPKGMDSWIKESLERAIKTQTRSDKGFKLWHIQGLSESYQNEPCSFTFHETSKLTGVELNILKQQKVVFVSSKYTEKVFEEAGLWNVVYCPLGFDSHHFKKTGKEYLGKDVKVFGLYGKLESRKNTLRILSSWIKKFGNNKNYLLNCAISNPFLDRQRFTALISSTFPEGKKPFNVNFLDWQPTLEKYNDVLNAADVDLTGMSSCEGFNLPAFHSLGLGKWGVCLNAHVHQDFADENNSVLVDPIGFRSASDNVFFREGNFVNQGNWHDYNDRDFEKALEKVDKLAKTPNPNGEKLVDKFTWRNTVETILTHI